MSNLKAYLDQGFKSKAHQKAFFSKVSTKPSVQNFNPSPSAMNQALTKANAAAPVAKGKFPDKKKK